MIAEHAVTTIRLNSNELSGDIIEGVKRMFPNREILLRVEPVGETYEQTILRRTEELAQGGGVTFTIEEFDAFVAKLP